MVVCLMSSLVYLFIHLFIEWALFEHRLFAGHSAGLSHVDLVLTDEYLVFI